MKKNFKRRSSFVSSPTEPDIAVLIRAMQQQLVSLEMKVDTLIRQSSERAFQGKYPPRSSPRADRSFSYNKQRRDIDSKEIEFTQVICSVCKKECEVPFKPTRGNPVYCRECFSKSNKATSFKEKYAPVTRNGNPAGGNRFVRHQGGESRRYDKKQKPFEKKEPFYLRRKKRA